MLLVALCLLCMASTLVDGMAMGGFPSSFEYNGPTIEYTLPRSKLTPCFERLLPRVRAVCIFCRHTTMCEDMLYAIQFDVRKTSTFLRLCGECIEDMHRCTYLVSDMERCHTIPFNNRWL